MVAPPAAEKILPASGSFMPERGVSAAMSLPWVMLVVAGLLEVVWASLMKQSEGFTKLWPSVATVAAMLVSFLLLSQAMRSLPLGTAYAVWVGIGAVGAALVGMAFLGEPRSALRVFFIATILGGIAGLKVTSGH